MAITFAGPSAVYSGDHDSVARSPFRNADGTETADKYLNARANGSVEVEVTGAKLDTLRLLWGSVDFTNDTYNRIELFDGAKSVGFITGAGCGRKRTVVVWKMAVPT